MPWLEEAIEKCNQLALTALDTLRPWVEQNSYSTNLAGVNALADRLAADFRMEGLSLERAPGDGVGDHLVWTTPAWSEVAPAGRLVLVGHHDTVFPPGSFETWSLEGDILRGPGVLDMKGGLLTIYLALRTLASFERLGELPLAFVSVGDEEIGSPHSAALLKKLAAGAGGALVFEAGRAGDAIITRRKGTGALVVRARGRAAHAGNHHREGRNAIWALAQLVDALQRLTDYEAGVSVNVGMISGGEARNTVPHSAQCGVDFRFVERAQGERVVARSRELAEEIAKRSEVAIEVEGGIRRPPLAKTPESEALYQRYAGCAQAAGLGTGETDLLGGGSDASTVSSVGVPAIDGLGPRGKGFHTDKEYIEVSSLALRAEALLRFLLDWKGEAASPSST